MENTTDTDNEAEEIKASENQDEINEISTEEVQADSETENVELKEVPQEENFKEKYYYLAAEMQNMQRRSDKEKENLRKFGSEKILKDMLDIVDNLERTLGFINKDEDEKVKNIVVGVEMISKMFVESLQKHGLKQIDALGKEFDPHFHEALAQQASEGKDNMEIIQVHQNGYTLNERVIRPSKVVVVKND
jgi:molecular chaperone GrpE